MKCVKVRTLISGEIDCADLKVQALAHKDKPAIINLNIGFFFSLTKLTHFMQTHAEVIKRDYIFQGRL